jgi:hypothetical protein
MLIYEEFQSPVQVSDNAILSQLWINKNFNVIYMYITKGKFVPYGHKVIKRESGIGVSLAEQDTIEYVSWPI